MKFTLCTLFLVIFFSFAPDSDAQKLPVQNLLQIAKAQENWPYVWLDRLESRPNSYTTATDSLRQDYRRLFLKGVAYFFILPSYASKQEWNPRIQILEKVIDNWREALKALKQLEEEDSGQKNRWSYEYNTLKNARTAVFNRYLEEKKTKHYQVQSFFLLFDFSKRNVLPGEKRSFIFNVVKSFPN